MPMADDLETPPRGYTTQDVKAVAEEQRRTRKSRWGLRLFALLVLLPVVLLALWTWGTLAYVYSRGDRVGYVQKFSQKGLVCKTWEGELAMSTVPGSIPQLFEFTVRDDAVAQRIRQVMETQDGRVALVYEQHKGVPTSCFGETQYYVVSAKPVTTGALPPLAPGAGGAASGTPASGAPASR